MKGHNFYAPLVTSWFSMVAGAPAIMAIFRTAGQRKGEKEAIGVYKLSFNGGPQELPHILILHLTGQNLVTWLNLAASVPEKYRMEALFWVAISPTETWDCIMRKKKRTDFGVGS